MNKVIGSATGKRQAAWFVLVFVSITFSLLLGTCSKPVSEEPKDNTPPNPITLFFFYGSSATSAELGWVAPGDDRTDSVARYDCRYSADSAVTEGWTDATPVPNLPTPGRSGRYERANVIGLDSLLTYYFAIRSIDLAGNASAVSQLLTWVAPPPDTTPPDTTPPDTTTVPPLDTIPPTAIMDLQVVSVDTFSVELSWTAPSEQVNFPATAYEIRYDTSGITEESWNDAFSFSNPPTPSAPGHQESLELTGLNFGTEYYFAVRSTDSAGNISPLSNVTMGKTIDTVLAHFRDTLLADIKTTFGTPSKLYPSALARCSDGGFIVSGGAGSPTSYYLAKLDDTGIVLWERTFGPGAGERLVDVTITNNDIIAAVGDGFGSDNKTALFWYDQQGNELKESKVDFSAAGKKGIAATPDGGVAVLHLIPEAVVTAGTIEYPAAQVLKYNALGENSWYYNATGGRTCSDLLGTYPPRGYASTIRVFGSQIVFSWATEWGQYGLSECSHWTNSTYATFLDLSGVSQGYAGVLSAYDFLYYHVEEAYIAEDLHVLSHGRFHVLHWREFGGYKLFAYDMSGHKLDNNGVQIDGIYIYGIETLNSGRLLLYGNELYGGFMLQVLDEAGMLHEPIKLSDPGAHFAVDATLNFMNDVVVLGQIEAPDHATVKGLFLRYKNEFLQAGLY